MHHVQHSHKSSHIKKTKVERNMWNLFLTLRAIRHNRRVEYTSLRGLAWLTHVGLIFIVDNHVSNRKSKIAFDKITLKPWNIFGHDENTFMT